MIYYIYHSGFVLELEKSIFIFDFYRIPTDKKNEEESFISKFIKRNDKKVYVFSSHSHSDHFNKEILKYFFLVLLQRHYGKYNKPLFFPPIISEILNTIILYCIIFSNKLKENLNKKRERSTSFPLKIAWQIHTLPGRFQPSTISVYGLNF